MFVFEVCLHTDSRGGMTADRKYVCTKEGACGGKKGNQVLWLDLQNLIEKHVTGYVGNGTPKFTFCCHPHLTINGGNSQRIWTCLH